MSREEHKGAIEVSIIFHEGQRMFAVPKQPAQQHVSVTDELVDDYCKAWGQSFSADNPYHTVSMTAGDRKHIEAGLKAALAEQPAQRTWVGLTDDEITDMWAESSPYYHEDDFARAIEAKLRSKNEDRN
jgi:hypothetical protein